MVGQEFASCHLKLGHARHHFNALKAELNGWVDVKPYSIEKKHDADGRRHAMVLNIRNQAFDRWSLMAADCITNLRSTLNHLVYAFAVRDTNKNIPPGSRTLQFPICDSLGAFQSQVARGRLKDLGPKAQAFVESAQPYHGRHAELPPILAVLREFNDGDKHRLLNIAATHLGAFDIKFKIPRDTPTHIYFVRSPAQSGAEIAHFKLDTAEPDVEYEYDLTFHITVSHIPGPTGRHVSPLGDILGLMILEVTRLVNDAILV